MRNIRLLVLSLSFVLSSFLCLGLAFIPGFSQAFSATGQNRIVSLYDAFGEEKGLVKDWGYSTLVEYKGKRILFDAGNNADVFKKNVQKLGVDLKKIDFAVLSHPHADHLSGFDYLVQVNPNVKIYVPEDVHVLGAPRNFPFGGPDPSAAEKLPVQERYFGSTEKERIVVPSGRFYPAKNVEYLSKNLEVAPGIHLIATKSPYLGGFNGYPPNSPEKPALNGLPELSLSLQTAKGELLVVGCSHTGVERIVQTTKTALGRNVDTVVGGLHLFPYDEPYIEKLAYQLRDELGVRHVSPTHCTGHIAFRVFRQIFGKEYEFAGLGSQIRFSA
jgi:7,8-dihydropterin-6-yl-methyl-4-(beta-D-ribofuranosyl)aminobenzene 5'-phosphate synthase